MFIWLIIIVFQIPKRSNIFLPTKKGNITRNNCSFFFPSKLARKNLYIPVSQLLLSLSCISMCSEGKQTDRQIDRHTVKKKNRRMSATTTSDAMLRTRFVCYLYSFSLPFFFFDDDDGYTALQTNGRRMIFYLRHTREEPLICLYICVLPCSDDDATEMKRVLRRGGTLQWDVREETRKKGREREGKIYEEKHKHIYITLAPIIERFHSVLLTSHRCAWISTKEKRERERKTRNVEMVMFFFDILFLSLSRLHSYTSYQR